MSSLFNPSPSGGSSTWGAIGGTLADQTDLQTALNAKANDSAVVKLTGDQTVAGVKTFSSSPIVPAPTTDLQAATKKYVDDNSLVDSVFGRTGAVVAATNDYTWAQVNKATSSIADITTKSHTLLTDIGTNTHAQIDTDLTRLANTSGTNTGDQNDHGTLDGLSDDDHTQYLLADGSRDLVGSLTIKNALTATKAYRLRLGSDADFETGDAHLYISCWSGADFTGSQRTKMMFQKDADEIQVQGKISYRTGIWGTTRHSIDGSSNGGVVFNEDGANTDTRIEGDTDENLVFVDAGLDRVGIGVSAPSEKLDVLGNILASGTITGSNLSGTNTGDQDLSGYALLAGRAGGQTLIGGTGSGNDLTLQSTSNATKGSVVVSDDFEVYGNIGIGNSDPVAALDINTSSGSPSGTPLFTARFTQGAGTPGFIAERTDASRFVSLWAGTNASVLGWQEDSVRLALGTYTYANRYSNGFPTKEVMSILSTGSVGIDATSPSSSTKLEVGGTDGAFLLPRLTTTQRDALTAINGMLIYNSTTGTIQGRTAGSWSNL